MVREVTNHEKWLGKSIVIDPFSTDLQLSVKSPRVVVVHPDFPVHSILMPLPRNQIEGRWFEIISGENNGTHNITIKDSTGATLFTLAGGDWASIYLANASAATWKWHTGTAGSIPNTPASELGYVFGGTNNPETVYELDTQTLTWLTKSPSSNDREDGAGFGVSGVGYLAGGISSGESQTLDRYDPDTWTTGMATLAAASDLNSGAGVGSNGYLIGRGLGASDEAKADKYDVGGDAWSAMTDRPAATAAREHTAQAVGSIIFVANGFESAGGLDNECDELDPAGSGGLGTWTARATRPAPFSERLTSFSDGTSFWCMGGNDGTGYYNDVDRWDPDGGTGTWTAEADYPAGGRSDACGLAANGKGYVCGGQTAGASSTRTADAAVFDPSTSAWTSLGNDLPEAKTDNGQQGLGLDR